MGFINILITLGLFFCLTLSLSLPETKRNADPVEFLARTLSITARDRLSEFYVDGIAVSIPYNTSWEYAGQVYLEYDARLIAFLAVADQYATCFGALASVEREFMVTSPDSCKCTDSSYPNYYYLGFDDSDWSKAVRYGSNNGNSASCFGGQVVTAVSRNASWVWHDRTGFKDRAYCRCYLPVCAKNPCQHNGVCQPNADFLCACPPNWTGRFCEIEQTVNLTITSKEQITSIFIDGFDVGSQANFNAWQSTDTISYTRESRLVAVMATNFANNCSGILASSPHDVILTNATWRCETSNQANWMKLDFNDKTWRPAVVMGANNNQTKSCFNRTIDGVSSKAQWIWTSHPPNVDQVVYCRSYLPGCNSMPCRNGGTCLKDTELLCKCLPGFYGRYCELVQYFPVSLTASDAIDVVYVDGKLVTLKNSTNLLAIDTFFVEPTTRLIAVFVQCYNSLTDNCRGLLGSVGVQGLTTDNVHWRCSNVPLIGWFSLGYADAGWALALKVGVNTNASRCSTTPQIEGIPPTAMWIWNNPANAITTFCRGYIDICANKPCQNGGTCVLNAPAFCRCVAGYAGKYCEIKIGVDVQSGIDCHENGYAAIASDGSHVCECFDGYTGKNCEIQKKFCQDVECMNGGVCHDVHNGFQCVCKGNFGGVHCQNSI